MKKLLGEGVGSLVADYRFYSKGDLDKSLTARVIEKLKARNPDILVVSIGNARNADFLKLLIEARITPALFLSGRIDALRAELANA